MTNTLKCCGCFIFYFLALVPKLALGSEAGSPFFFNPLVRDNQTIPKIQSLRFVTVDSFAPFSSFDSDGALHGIHVDMARAICAELNIVNSCTLQAVAFADATNLLASEQADVALSGLVPNAQNRKDLSFSVPYFRYPSKFLMQKGISFDALTEVGVISENVHQSMIKVLFPKLKILTFSDETAALEALNKGGIKALFGDGLSLTLAQNKSGFLNCCEFENNNYYLPSLRSDHLSATVSIRKPEILSSINIAIKQIAAKGVLNEIYLRHLPFDLERR